MTNRHQFRAALHWVRVVLCGLVSLFAAGLAVLPAAAAQRDQAVQTDVRQKVNLAGRQRMLSQRMAAASCMAMADVDETVRVDVALSAHSEFTHTLVGLRSGDDALGLAAETDASVLSKLAQVEAIWRTMGPVVQQLSHGDAHAVVVAQLMDLNMPLLKSSNDVVQSITATYAAGKTGSSRASTIDIAGRQRMLSQKMMKEACFVAVGLNADENVQNLTATIALFETSLGQLLTGDASAGISAPPSDALLSQLQKVETHWELFRLGLSLLDADSPTSRAALADLAAQSDLLLQEMHKAVLLYVSHGE